MQKVLYTETYDRKKNLILINFDKNINTIVRLKAGTLLSRIGSIQLKISNNLFLIKFNLGKHEVVTSHEKGHL
jgi:hypothetical protein